MKFNHLTIGTDNKVWDTKKILSSDENRAAYEARFWKIMNSNGRRIEVLNGIFATGCIGENFYEIDLFDKKRTLLISSVGVVDEEERKLTKTPLKTSIIFPLLFMIFQNRASYAALFSSNDKIFFVSQTLLSVPIVK